MSEQSHYEKAVEGLKDSVKQFNEQSALLRTMPVTTGNASAVAQMAGAVMANGAAIDQARATLALVDAVRSLDSNLRELLAPPPPVARAAEQPGLSDGGTVAGMRLGDAEAWERAASVVPVDEEHDDATACDEHLTAPGECCPHCPGWTVNG